MTDWNDAIIEDFRANGGRVERFGDGLVIMNTIGAKTGELRVKPVVGLPQPDGSWLVAATYGGNDKNPPWFHNLVAHPDIDLEVAGDGAVEVVPVHATVLDEPERTAGWQQFLDFGGSFPSYEEKTARAFPILRLTRR
jgi:deazaflavin-dependent oxidoreductase (nitroreductase family)